MSEAAPPDTAALAPSQALAAYLASIGVAPAPEGSVVGAVVVDEGDAVLVRNMAVRSEVAEMRERMVRAAGGDAAAGSGGGPRFSAPAEWMFGEGGDDGVGGSGGGSGETEGEFELVGVANSAFDVAVLDEDMIEGADSVTEEEFVRIRKRRIERLLEVYEASALSLRHLLRARYARYLAASVRRADSAVVASALASVAKRKRKAKRLPIARAAAAAAAVAPGIGDPAAPPAPPPVETLRGRALLGHARKRRRLLHDPADVFALPTASSGPLRGDAGLAYAMAAFPARILDKSFEGGHLTPAATATCRDDACPAPAASPSPYCMEHICRDARQTLFDPCASCHRPVLRGGGTLCRIHAPPHH